MDVDRRLRRTPREEDLRRLGTARGGRKGRAESSDGVLDLELSRSKEMGGEGGSGTNPEQLFAAGYCAFFEGALRLIAGRQRKEVGDAAITANVDFGKTEDGGFGFTVELVGHLPDLPRQEAEALMEEATGSAPTPGPRAATSTSKAHRREVRPSAPDLGLPSHHQENPQAQRGCAGPEPR